MNYTAGDRDGRHTLEVENEALKQMVREYYRPEIERLNNEIRWLRMVLRWHGIETR